MCAQNTVSAVFCPFFYHLTSVKHHCKLWLPEKWMRSDAQLCRLTCYVLLQWCIWPQHLQPGSTKCRLLKHTCVKSITTGQFIADCSMTLASSNKSNWLSSRRPCPAFFPSVIGIAKIFSGGVTFFFPQKLITLFNHHTQYTDWPPKLTTTTLQPSPPITNFLQ